MSFATTEFWIALLQIIMINIVLSGDNAVVIALASRSLPPSQQRKAIIFGSVGAIVMRLGLTFFAVMLLNQPYLKLVVAALLLWIGVGLLKGGNDSGDLKAHSNLAAAIKTIIVADLVMSVDNVIGVAAAAKGNVTLLALGLVISIPLIIYGSTVILKLMTRFPAIITIGAGLLGWVAGEMAVSDPALGDWMTGHDMLHMLAPAAGAALVVLSGTWLLRRSSGTALGVSSEQAAG